MINGGAVIEGGYTYDWLEGRHPARLFGECVRELMVLSA
jgi:hypothetical protein